MVKRKIAYLHFLKPWDWGILIFCLVALLSMHLILSQTNYSDAKQLYVKTAEGEFFYPLDKDLQKTFEGPIGETTIAISNHLVSFVKSDCRDKICIQHAALEFINDWNACLPNAVFARIVGLAQESTLDAQVY